MTKQERTFIFNILVIIFNVIIGLAVELALIAILFGALLKIPGVADSFPVQVILPFLLLAGLIIAMVISVKCVTWAIKTFKLTDKIDQKIIKRYIREDDV